MLLNHPINIIRHVINQKSMWKFGFFIWNRILIMKNDENKLHINLKNQKFFVHWKSFIASYFKSLHLTVAYFLIFINLTCPHHTFWIHMFSIVFVTSIMLSFQKCTMNLLFFRTHPNILNIIFIKVNCNMDNLKTDNVNVEHNLKF
jgi:hypothetical protein